MHDDVIRLIEDAKTVLVKTNGIVQARSGAFAALNEAQRILRAAPERKTTMCPDGEAHVLRCIRCELPASATRVVSQPTGEPGTQPRPASEVASATSTISLERLIGFAQRSADDAWLNSNTHTAEVFAAIADALKTLLPPDSSPGT